MANYQIIVAKLLNMQSNKGKSIPTSILTVIMVESRNPCHHQENCKLCTQPQTPKTKKIYGRKCYYLIAKKMRRKLRKRFGILPERRKFF